MGRTPYLFYLQSHEVCPAESQQRRDLRQYSRHKIMNDERRQEMMAENIKRREFIGGLAAIWVAAKVPGARGQSSNGEMPYRTLGKTGVKVSAIGLGGFHLGLSHLEEPDAIKIFHAAVDRGINFSDNSWDYNQGASEKRVGKALKNGYSDKVFVMTKFDGRTRDSALKQLDESLQRLEVDHVDLWQFHENIRLEDPDRFFAEGGAAEAMQEAKKAGKIRFMGFTGHKDPSVHLRILEMADKHGFSFDTAQMQETDGRPGYEAHGKREHFESQSGDTSRVPAIRFELANLGGNYRRGQHGHSGSGI